MEVIYVFIGVLIGFAVSSIIRRKHPVGFLRIDKSDSDGPYLFLELKKSVIINKRRTFDQVPEKFKADVEAKLLEYGYDTNGDLIAEEE